MAKGTAILVVLALAVVGQALTPTSYFTQGDLDRLKVLFGSVSYASSDLETIYYSILGFSLLEEPIPKPQEACDSIKSKVDTNNLESLFYATESANILKTKGKTTCQFPTGHGQTVLTEALGSSSTKEIYMAVAASSVSKVPVDNAKILTALEEALKTDETAISYGYAFLAASKLSGDLKKIYDLIEDVIAQADEVDEQFLQFDGGLLTTAIVIDGAYKLAEAAKKAPTLTEDKVIQFANYFLSRKHAQLMSNAVNLLSVVKTLTTNQFHIPVTVSLASQVSVSESNPKVQVRVSNLLGQSIGKLAVTADTARHLGDDAVVLSKAKFEGVPKDESLYELDFMGIKPARGFYSVIISVAPVKSDKRLIGTTGANVEVKVTTKVSIEDVKVGIAEKDQVAATRSVKLVYPNKAANVLQADFHQKVSVMFQLQDQQTKDPMEVHQAFVRLTKENTDQEIIFVAEADASSTYKFELDVGANAKDFGYQSGKYAVELIIGDAVVENPFSWNLAEVSLTFPEGPESKSEDPYRYAKKPEIKHMFREPEKVPPAVVSNLFTFLVLSPLLLLVIMWIALGANVSNFPFSLSALGFHLGLAGIFGLYYCYWLTLDMFVTLRYLGMLAIPTFLFGNRLLSGIAADRKKSA